MGPITGGASPLAPRLLAISLALTLGALLPRAAGARYISVPDDHPTVRAAVAAAANGDVIVVGPGTHPGGAFIDNKAVSVASWYLITGDTSWVSRTVLSGVAGDPCGGAPGCVGNSVLEYGSNADASRIIGLTLTHGENGVGSSGTVDISHCRVVGNGDGVDFVGGAGGTFDHSVFMSNSDDGIDLNGHMNVTIEDNIIQGNGDDGIEYRLQAYVGPMTHVVIRRNRIRGNGEDGIQLIDYPAVSDLDVRIERNVFTANYGGAGSSAAIGCMPNGNTVENLVGHPIVERVYLINNTFVGERYGMVGGGNVIALNNLFSGTEVCAVRRVQASSIVAYSLFWNNATNYQTSVADTTHDVRADPLLRPDAQLATGSPAINQGTAFFTWQGDTVLALPPGSFIGPRPDLGGVEHVPNLAPAVDAGPDQTVTLPASAHLAGQVTDDGRLVPEGDVDLTWSVVSGPGPVTLDSPNSASTGAAFTTVGIYVLQLTAFDGELTGADSLQISVLAVPGPVDRWIAAAADDAEEEANGSMSTLTGGIELVQNLSLQTVGLRFVDVAVPAGATIKGAYIQFRAAAIQSGATDLLLRAQAADIPAPFVAQVGNISSRPRTAAGVAWAPPPWNVVGAAGVDQRTPDLSALVQEVVNRPGWASGNPMVFIVTGTGRRTAVSYEGSAAGAAHLHIEFSPAVADSPAEVPSGLALRLAGAHPARGALRVELSLTGPGPASLTLLDVAGRQWAAHDVGALGPGRHEVELGTNLPVGVYFVRLAQGHRTKVMRAVVLK